MPRTTVQVICMLCPARISESDNHCDEARARVDARAIAEGWKLIGDCHVCKTCGAKALKAFAPSVENALGYMLRRVRTDVDLFYVMDHTEALARLCVAISEMSGEPLEKFSAAMKLPLFPPSQLSRVEIARARVAELEEQTEMLRRRVGE